MIRWYKGRVEFGRPPFDLVVQLKILLVAYLYNISERQVEGYNNDSMSTNFFRELGIDQFTTDHFKLTKFKERMILCKRDLKLKQLLADIVQNSFEQTIRFGSVQLVDSALTARRISTLPSKANGRKRKKPH